MSVYECVCSCVRGRVGGWIYTYFQESPVSNKDKNSIAIPYLGTIVNHIGMLPM